MMKMRIQFALWLLVATSVAMVCAVLADRREMEYYREVIEYSRERRVTTTVTQRLYQRTPDCGFRKGAIHVMPVTPPEANLTFGVWTHCGVWIKEIK